jgi:CRISPR-associated endonuclease Cas2
MPATHNTLRSKLTKKFIDYGLERIQYSVFVGNLTKNRLENLKLEVLELINGNPVDIRVFHLTTDSHTPDDIWSEYKAFDDITFLKEVLII